MRRTPFLHIVLLIAFVLNTIAPGFVLAQEITLPKPGVMIRLSPPVAPAVLKGLKVNPDHPFRFDFILDPGDSAAADVKDESAKLIKYFLASLTIPEKDLWVNLSPYEKDRIIPTSFGVTEMGRDLLAEDYLLKQVTASLIYPEDEVGRKFWKRVYEEAQAKFKTTNIPVNTFNKVWIVPDKAVVYENAKAGTAYVVESKLKVLLEADYLSLSKHEASKSIPRTKDEGSTRKDLSSLGSIPRDDAQQLGTEIVRQIVIPELTREVNEGKNFARLRQVYSSLILATWYKKKIKDSVLSRVYADKNKVLGVDVNAQDKQKIYEQYVQAFKKGVYNYIKEEPDPLTNERIPRKYFSGGVEFDKAMRVAMKTTNDEALIIGRQEADKLLMVTGGIVVAGSKQSEPVASADTDTAMLGVSGRRQFLSGLTQAIAGATLSGMFLAGEEAQASTPLVIPPTIKDRNQYKTQARQIYGPLKPVLDNLVAQGPDRSRIRNIPTGIKGQTTRGRDVVFEHLQEAKRYLDEALDERVGLVGDQEKLYHVAAAVKLASQYDANDRRLLAFKEQWEGMQKIYLLDERFDSSKPTALLIHGIGVGVFPYFNNVLSELRKTHNVAFIVYDFLRPAYEVADLLNKEVAAFEARRNTKIKGFVPYSYGFTVFTLAMQRNAQVGGSLYNGANVAALSPMIGGTKKFDLFKMIDPTSWFGLNLGLRVTKAVFRPSAKDFIDAVNPKGRVQRAVDDFVQREMLTRVNLTALFAPEGNDLHLDLNNSAYQLLKQKGAVAAINSMTKYKAEDQHSYLATENEAVRKTVAVLDGKKADLAMISADEVNYVNVSSEEADRILRMAQAKPGERLLDLGSGRGGFAIEAAQQGLIVKGIEMNEEQLSQANRLKASYVGQGVIEDQNVTFEQGDFMADSFSYKDYDIVYMFSIMSSQEQDRFISKLMKEWQAGAQFRFVYYLAWSPEGVLSEKLDALVKEGKLKVEVDSKQLTYVYTPADRALTVREGAEYVSLDARQIKALQSKMLIYPPDANPKMVNRSAGRVMTAAEFLGIMTSVSDEVKRVYAKDKQYYDSIAITLRELFRKFDVLTVPQKNVMVAFLNQRGNIRIFKDAVAQGTPNDSVNLGGYFMLQHGNLIHEIGHVVEPLTTDIFNLMSVYPDTDVSPTLWSFYREILANRIGGDHLYNAKGVLAESKKSYMRLWNLMREMETKDPTFFPKRLDEMTAQEVMQFLDKELVRRALSPVLKVAEGFVVGQDNKFKGELRKLFQNFGWREAFIQDLFRQDGQVLADMLKTADLRAMHREASGFNENAIIGDDVRLLRDYRDQAMLINNQVLFERDVVIKENPFKLELSYKNKALELIGKGGEFFVYAMNEFALRVSMLTGGRKNTLGIYRDLSEDKITPNAYFYGRIGPQRRSYLLVDRIVGQSLDKFAALDEKQFRSVVELLVKQFKKGVNLYDMKPEQYMFGYKASDESRMEQAWLTDPDYVEFKPVDEELLKSYKFLLNADDNPNVDSFKRFDLWPAFLAALQADPQTKGIAVKELNADEAQKDSAMEVKKGGIDFNADKLNLQIQNAGEGIKFNVDPKMLQQLQNAPGFTPVIINIQPLQNLPLFLGIKENQSAVRTT